MDKIDNIRFKRRSPLEFQRTGDGKLIVSGWSVHTGLYQGDTVEIKGSELKNVAESLVGKQLRRNHSTDTEDVVGKILETKVGLHKDIGKKGVRYQGVIRDAELEQQIEDEFIEDVSIGFTLYPECSKCGEDFRYCSHWFDEAHVIARDIKCYEQSFVSIGADGNSTVEPGAAFNEENFMVQFSEKDPSNFYAGGKLFGKDKEIIFKAAEEEKQTKTETKIDNTDGEKMEEFEKLQGEYDALMTEFSEMKTAKENLETEFEKVKGEKEALEARVTEVEGEKEQLQAKVTENEKAEEARLAAVKEALCKEIAGLELAKKHIGEEEVDARVEELSKLEDAGLEQLKVALEREPVKAGKTTPKVGEFDNGAQEGALPEGKDGEDITFTDIARGMFRYKIKQEK